MAEVKNAGKKQDILFDELLYKIGGEETESLLKQAHEEHELREQLKNMPSSLASSRRRLYQKQRTVYDRSNDMAEPPVPDDLIEKIKNLGYRPTLNSRLGKSRLELDKKSRSISKLQK